MKPAKGKKAAIAAAALGIISILGTIFCLASFPFEIHYHISEIRNHDLIRFDPGFHFWDPVKKLSENEIDEKLTQFFLDSFGSEDRTIEFKVIKETLQVRSTSEKHLKIYFFLSQLAAQLAPDVN